MPPKNELAQELKNLLGDLLPPDGDYIPVVKKEEQQRKLALLNENLSNESFYFVFNLRTSELEDVRGVEKWLGFPDKEYTVVQYLNGIHPVQTVLHNMIAHSMYKTLCGGRFRLHFDKQKYMSLIGLRHYNGEYIQFKKITSVFQYDTENRLLAQLNEFHKIGSYENGPISPRIMELQGLQKEDFERKVFAMTLEAFMGEKIFSPGEFDVLKSYAEDETLGSKQLAVRLKIKENTVDTYNKRILQKARETFPVSFTSAREVALFLKKEKIFNTAM